MLDRYNNIHVLFMLGLLNLISINNAAKILAVYPSSSISHQVVFRPITLELIKRGHEVIVITADPIYEKGKTPQNLTEIDVHDISYNILKERTEFLEKGNPDNHLDVLKTLLLTSCDYFVEQFNTDDVQRLIKNNEQFDLILAEAFMRTPLLYSHTFKAPVIQVSSFYAFGVNYLTVGSPGHYLLFPDISRKKLYDLSLWEKIEGIYEELYFQNILADVEKYEDEVVRRLTGDENIDLKELSNNVDMLFLNVNPIWEGNRPVPPNVIHMGGIHIKPEKELPQDLKSYLDSSKHGVIYMSFGTNVRPSHLPPDRLRIFTKVFSKLPYDVLWKFDKDDIPGKPDNVRVTKWVPQSDLLRHPNIKLFITQGGLQSTDETILAGVPVLVFPMLGDQWYNAEKIVRHKIGLQFEMREITEEILENAIKKVIGEKSFKENTARLRDLMQDQPQTPLERAIWWIEYVIRHGGAKHLRSPLANISWWEYLVLDVVLVVGSVFVIALLLVIFIIKLILNKLFQTNSSKAKKNN